MRHCSNEDVQVYESKGPDLAILLIEAQVIIRQTEHAYANVHTTMNEDCDYIVTLYLH